MSLNILIINTGSFPDDNLIKQIKKTHQDSVIIVCANAQESLQITRELDPDIIFLTIPDNEPGDEVFIKTLKKSTRLQNSPIVFITNDATSDKSLKSASKVADAFLRFDASGYEIQLVVQAMYKIREYNSLQLQPGLKKDTTGKEKIGDSEKEIEKALNESEERYRLIVENQNDLIVKFNQNRELIYVNPNYCKCFGFDENEILGKKFFPLIHKDDLKTVKSSINSLSIPPHRSYHEERDKTVDGWRWFGWSKKALLDKKGDIIEVVAVGRDITDRKEVQKKLLESEATLRELNATKDKFFSIIAHDLRGPFNSILGFSELIAEKCNSGDFKDVCKMSNLLNSSAQHSFQLLTNLLEWSRTQRGKKLFKPSDVNILDIVKEEIDLVSLTSNKKNISIKKICPDIQVFADYNMLQTVFRNLLSNAVKYSLNGGEIIVKVMREEKEVKVSVFDNGVGISKEKKKKLFNIGEVESTPGTSNEKGTGLGLILCKEFVEIHGGKIWVESIEGGGSVFYFTLPLPKNQL